MSSSILVPKDKSRESRVVLPMLPVRHQTPSMKTRLLYESLVGPLAGIHSANKTKRGPSQRQSNALPVSISQTGANLVGHSRYNLYNYRDTREKERRPKAASLGGRNNVERIQKVKVSRKASSAPYGTADDQTLPNLPKLNNLVSPLVREKDRRKDQKDLLGDKVAGTSTEIKEKRKFASSWSEFRTETVAQENSNSSPKEAADNSNSVKAKPSLEADEAKIYPTDTSILDTPNKIVHPKEPSNEKTTSNNKANASKSDNIGEVSSKSSIPTVKNDAYKSSLKEKETKNSKTNEHVKFNESKNPAVHSKDRIKTNQYQRQNDHSKRIKIEEDRKQKVSDYKKKIERPKRQSISWRPIEKSSGHDENNNRMLSDNSDKPSMFGKPSGFSFSYTAGRKKADSLNKKPNATSKTNTQGEFPKRASLLRHRERSKPLLPHGLTQYSLKTRQDYSTAAREIRQPKNVYARETKKYLESQSRAGSRTSLVSVGTNRGGAKSTASSVYSRATNKMLPWHKNGYTLSQRETSVYRGINSVYGAQTIKNKFQRQRQFYNKLEQVQLEEIRNFNANIRQDQLKTQQKKIQQQKELKRMRDKFSDERDKRFRNQYVTSRLLQHEKEPVHHHSSSSKNNTKLSKSEMKPVSQFDKTANMVKNYKKYSSIFQLHGGPSWDSSTSPPRMEGVDVVKLEEMDATGHSIEKKLDVKKLLDSAQHMLNISGPDDDAKSTISNQKENADNLSLDSLNLDDDEDLFEKARRKYGLNIDD